MSIRQRLYPDNKSSDIMSRHCADARFVYNLGLEQRNLWVRERKTKVNYLTQCKELAEARRQTWLGAGSSSVQQNALRDLDQAFQYWWKNPQHFGRPTWRKAGVNESFRIVYLQARQINSKWGEVLIPKVGYVRFRLTREWSDIKTAKSARITLDKSQRWHISFVSPQSEFVRQLTNSVVGIDLGIAHSVTLSDGKHIDMPILLSPGEKQRKRRLQRQMIRQKKGSNRKLKTKHSLAKISAKETDRRKDWIEKTTTNLVKDFDVIVIENLNIKNMSKSAKGTIENPGVKVKAKSGLNRKIRSQAWGMFRTRLTDKAGASTSPVEIIVINPAFTSQRCSGCGHTTKENRKNQAIFLCQSCTYTDNADVNASKNILAAGLAVTGRGGTPDLIGPMKRQPSKR
jgi:putative transposase